MKRIILSIIFVLFCHFVFAQSSIKYKQLVVKGSDTYINDNGKQYLQDKTVVTVKLKPNLTDKQLNQFKVDRINKLGYADIHVPNNMDVEAFAQKLDKTILFESIEYNSYGEYSNISNDTYVPQQWYLNTIKTSSAWNLTMGKANVKVAVLDSGVDHTHYDLGYGNDTYKQVLNSIGWNYATGNGNVITTNEHGTRVAGILGAKTNNSYGIAGVTGGNNYQGVSIIPYCVGIISPNGSVVDDAIIDAVDKGAKVIQLSLNVASSDAINAAIEYAYSNNVTIVCAAGNNNTNVAYPASHSKTIAVGASDKTNHRASFSNYGTGLDLVAPGVDIFSTSLNNGYSTDDGTSFAAPQVSGTIALMLSVNPTLTPDTIRSILRSTCTKLSGYTYTSGWNNETGYGLLNTYAAVSSVIPKIYGRDFFLYTSDYNVSSSPLNDISNWDVSWSADFQINGVYTTLQVDSLNHFHCTVIKDSIAPINHNIYATLYYNGDSITTIKKKIYGHMKKGNAFYLLKRYPQGNIIDAALLKPNNTINITTGQFYTINSVNIGGMNVEEFTVYPNNLSRYMGKEDDNIRIKIDSNGSVIYRVWGYDESGTLEDFRFTIHANSSTTYMSVSKSDNIFTVELKESEVEKSDNIENVTVINDDMEWTIGVTNALKGKQILAKKVKGKSTSFDTSGWPQGLYVIRVIVNGETLTEKIYIINK